MQGILYEEPSFWLFALITVIMGGWAAWMTGRAIAITWRPYWTLILYLLILGAAVRFIHHALFEGTLLSVHYYAIDTIVMLIVGTLGFQYYRARQMTTQYRWMYERTGPFTWREKSPAA
ncbi:DUF6867 family protein [Microvirga pudoricolor]|uniref:DUF6867 family protein n=1 Tax=Microvirga pudoricolor TaxID=2778729 RepID=UPI0019518F5E|nr:hypothetical protein [Microvirga pudoricolor]MBM6595964.1 hypothetical protein [Microvirga pudoricolor]